MKNCGQCPVPQVDMTVAWTNPITGDGSTTMKFSGGFWQSECSNNVIYEMSCANTQMEFRVRYFTVGPCPTGQSERCSNLAPAPFKLIQTTLRCGYNFEMDLACDAACPALQLAGFRTFKVTVAGTPPTPPRCRVCFSVTGCGPVAGVTVTVSGGPGSGGSGTTNSVGFVAIDIGSQGTYTVSVPAASYYDAFSKSMALECGKGYAINLFAKPTLTLSLTTEDNEDLLCNPPSGSIPLNKDAPLEWFGRYFVPGHPELGHFFDPFYLRFTLFCAQNTFFLAVAPDANPSRPFCTLNSNSANVFTLDPFDIEWDADVNGFFGGCKFCGVTKLVITE
jgi:hypothetical protein